MYLRNIDPGNGVCNGTRLQVKSVKRNVLELTILGGKNSGNIVLMQRIKLTTDPKLLPFMFE